MSTPISAMITEAAVALTPGITIGGMAHHAARSTPKHSILATSIAGCCKRVVVWHLHQLVQLPSPNAHVAAIEQR